MKNIISKIALKLFPQPSLREEIADRVMRLTSYYKIENGDYLEFGVHLGKSFVASYKAAQRYGLKDMKFYAFDSFAGLPDVKGIDEVGSQFRRGDYACTEEQFKKNLQAKGVNLNKVVTVPGWYDNTLSNETKKKLPLKAAAVVWIDCDLYESTVPVLNFLTDYIVDGTILVFDDWFCFRGSPERGEQKIGRAHV